MSNGVDQMYRLNQLLKCYIVDEETGCWNWTRAKMGRGYGHLTYNGKNVRAHRFFYENLIGPIPEDLHVLHKCDNPLCVNPKHLFLGTHQDNVQDMVTKGRHGKSKLTEDQVQEIRLDVRRSIIIAKEYGVHRSTINRIKSGIRWKHVK